jgi:hypothetical protein
MPPQLDSTWFLGICEQGARPLVVTGWLRLWLTCHFGNAEFLEDQDPNGPIQRSVWKPNLDTGIVIESVTKWLPEMTETRPGVIIKRNGWKRMRLGIDDRMMGTNNVDGLTRHENWWQGGHTLFCISNDGAETELLAAEVFRELNEFGPVIRAILDLKRFEVTEVGELAILKEGRENFVVPVGVSYAYSQAWVIQPAAPKIKRFDVAMLVP